MYHIIASKRSSVEECVCDFTQSSNFVDEYLEDYYVEHFMVWRHTDKYGEKSTVRLARSLGNKQCLVCSHLASLTSMVLLNLTLQHLVEHGDTL